MPRFGFGMAVALLGSLTAAGRAPAQLPSDVVPLHSFADVPDLPKDVPALVKRYGDVATSDGTEKGDLATETLRERENGWMKPGVPPSMDYSSMMGGAGVMSPTVGQAIGDLVQEVQQMTADFTAAVQKFGLTTVPPLKQAYEAKLDAIHKEYDPKVERCLTLNERAGGASCGDPEAQRDAAINAATAVFLQTANGQYVAFRDRMKQIAAGGEAAIDRATKTFGKSTPGIAKMQIMGIRQNELDALLGVLSAEQDLFLYAYGNVPASSLPPQTP